MRQLILNYSVLMFYTNTIYFVFVSVEELLNLISYDKTVIFPLYLAGLQQSSGLVGIRSVNL